MRITSTPDSTTTLNAPHLSLRHFSRDVTRHGPHHITIVIVAVSASVGGVFVTLLFWRFLSRLSERSRSTPLPPRQALVHQREHQLTAISEEHKNITLSRSFLNVQSSAPIRHGSNASLILHTDTSHRASFYTHETGEGTDGPPSSHGSLLYPPPPPFFTPHLQPSSSSTSLPSSNGHSPPSSEAITLATSMSPNQSLRRPNTHSRSRPLSMVRSSVRGTPHAPHSNIEIVLPAPLAPNLYPHVAGDGPYGQEALVSNGMYRDSWRSSLADKWIVVGRHGGPEPKFLKRQRSHDTIERQARQTRRDVSPRPLPQQRSSSNPPSLSRRRQSSRPSLDFSPLDIYPPVPRVPPEHGTLPRQGAHAPSAPLGVSVNPPSSFPNSRKVRS